MAIQNSGATILMMPHERRVNIRKAPERFAYLSLPFDNGGIVLDISEGGLGFHAIAPVEADGPIHFRFAINSATRIKAVGELAWKDATGKTGGLRFTQLPDEIRQQIRVWANESKARVFDIPVAQPAIEAAVAPSRKADLARVVATRHPHLYNPLLYNFKPPIYSAPFYGLSMFPLELTSEAGATYVSVPQPVAIKHPIAAVGLTIALAFLISIGIFAYIFATQ
jgi:hypothetical protein